MITLTVYFKDQPCGTLIKHSETHYSYTYDETYLSTDGARPISVNLPLRAKSYVSETLHPFFDNLLSEGWLLDVQTALHKIDKRDRFALIEKCGLECMGAVSLAGTK